MLLMFNGCMRAQRLFVPSLGRRNRVQEFNVCFKPAVFSVNTPITKSLFISKTLTTLDWICSCYKNQWHENAWQNVGTHFNILKSYTNWMLWWLWSIFPVRCSLATTRSLLGQLYPPTAVLTVYHLARPVLEVGNSTGELQWLGYTLPNVIQLKTSKLF